MNFKRLFKNVRYWAVGLLGGLGFLMVLSVPEADDLVNWFVGIAILQAIGWGLLFLAHHLFKKWVKKGKIDITGLKE